MKFFGISQPPAAYMLLLLEAQWFESSESQAVINAILNLSCSVYVFQYRFYATGPNAQLLLFVLCFKVFIKSKPTTFIFFSNLMILFARTNFKKEKAWTENLKAEP